MLGLPTILPQSHLDQSNSIKTLQLSLAEGIVLNTCISTVATHHGQCLVMPASCSIPNTCMLLYIGRLQWCCWGGPARGRPQGRSKGQLEGQGLQGWQHTAGSSSAQLGQQQGQRQWVQQPGVRRQGYSAGSCARADLTQPGIASPASSLLAQKHVVCSAASTKKNMNIIGYIWHAMIVLVFLVFNG